jgi:hypothetical protein
MSWRLFPQKRISLSARWLNALLWSLVGAVMLLALYVATYRFMVIEYGDLDGQMHAAYDIFPEHGVAGLPDEDSAIGRFFAPIHWLDRRIRPEVWAPAP